MIPGRWGLLVAAIAGLLMSLAFPPVGFGPYAAAAVGLIAAVQFRRTMRWGLLTGLIAGLAFLLPLLHWLTVVGTDAWIALSAFCALWFALLGAGTALVSRLPLWPMWVAALWVLQETLRGSVPYGGFPWGRLAFAQPDAAFGRVAAFGGQPAVTFVVALAGCAIVAAVWQWRSGRPRLGWAWVTVCAAVTLGSALLPVPSPDDGRTMPVAIIQGGTPQTGMGAMDVRREVLDNHVRQTVALADRVARGEEPRPALVLWPESSSDIDPFLDAEAAQAISDAAEAIGAPILIGTVIDVPDNPNGRWNVSVLWDPLTGPGPRYVKTRLVPFGEFIPLRTQVAPLIGRLDRIPRDFIPGTKPGIFTVAGVTFANVICFEVAYDDVFGPLLERPVPFITVQTNNATYSGTSQPEQQLQIERMRAIEGGRMVLVAATTGVSAVITADGAVAQRIGEDAVGSLTVDVPLEPERTLASTGARAIGSVLSVVGLAALAWAGIDAFAARRRRRPKVEA